MKPLLSVVMPTYNGDQFVADALESVHQQLRDGIEVVIVDDGSTDQTLEIIHRFSTSLPIRLLTPGRVGNWVAATNVGLREATGEWACFLHQDDLWLPGRLDRLWPEMEAAAGSLIVHDAKYVGPAGQILGSWTCPFSPGLIPSASFVERLLIQNFLAIPSPLFRRDAVVASGALYEELWFSADWDLWLRLSALGPVRFLEEELCAFRVHPESQTASRSVRSDEWAEQLTVVLEDHLRAWPVAGNTRKSVEHAARASIAVNAALSATSRGGRVNYLPILSQLFLLGPQGWRRYLRDSRIIQRVSARLKLK